VVSRKSLVSIDDPRFRRIETDLGCKLPYESRQWIVAAGDPLGSFFAEMQEDLEKGIYEVADDLAKHLPAIRAALFKARGSPHISHWLLEFSGIDAGLALLGIKPDSRVQFCIEIVDALLRGAKHFQSMPRRGKGAPRQKNREFLATCLTKALTAIPSWPDKPSVGRFAKVCYPYLRDATAPKSHRALAALLSVSLSQLNQKER
jgi:hypothetical protein